MSLKNPDGVSHVKPGPGTAVPGPSGKFRPPQLNPDRKPYPAPDNAALPKGGPMAPASPDYGNVDDVDA